MMGLDQVQFFPDATYKYFDRGIEINKENIINLMQTFTEEEKVNILQDVNANIARREWDYKLGHELEKYLKVLERNTELIGILMNLSASIGIII